MLVMLPCVHGKRHTAWLPVHPVTGTRPGKLTCSTGWQAYCSRHPWLVPCTMTPMQKEQQV